MVAYMFSRQPTANFNTTPPSIARSATGSVYDKGDTGFTTPLNMTLVIGGAVVTTISSDALGFLPDFTLDGRVNCVWKQTGSSFATVLTTSDPIPGPAGPNTVPTQAAIQSEVTTPGTPTATALTATYEPKGAAAAAATPKLDKVDATPKFKSVASGLSGSRRPRNLRAGTTAFSVASTGHNAFPGMAACKDGSLLVVWRSAPQHNPTPTPGVIKARKYAANGTPLTAEYTVLTDALDLRDPMLTVLDNGDIVMQFFKHDGSATTIAGVWVAKSSDNGATFQVISKVPFTWDSLAASSSKLVVAANGDWLVTAYGRTSATYNHIRLMRSTNKGSSWGGEITVAEGQAASRNYVEPVMGHRPDGSLMCLVRVSDSDGSNPAIYSTTSTDNGVTWTASVSIITGSNGRPAWASLASGGILLTGRSATAPYPMQFRASWDNGATWTVATQLGQTPVSQGVYAQPVEVAPGLVGVVWGIEADAASSAALSWCYLADGSGWSPAGDDFGAVAAAYPSDVALADTFQRADSTVLGTAETGQIWSVVSGGIGIASNTAQINTGAGTSLVTADSGIADGSIECAWRWAGATSGNGLMLRWIDSANYIFTAIESSGGTLKLYKYDGGALTALATVTGMGLAGNTWHQVRVTLRGAVINVFVNGVQKINHVLSAANQTKYLSGTVIGLRATLDGVKFANLTVRRSFLDLAAGAGADLTGAFLNVRDYGAKGDGVTDDTAAIQAAINKAPSGAVVYFPWTGSGNFYKTTATINVTTPNLKLLGSGRAYATQIKCTTASVLMFSVKTSGLVVDGLTIVGDGGLNGSGATVKGFEMFGDVDGNVDSTFRGETCLINTATAIKTHGRNLVVEDNVTVTSSLRGILIDGKDATYHTGPNADQNRGHYIGGRFHNIGVDNTTAAIEVLAAAKMLHCVLAPRHIDSNGFGKHIVLTGTSADPCKGVTVKPAKFTECAADVITGSYLWNSVIETPHIVGDTTSTTYGSGIVLDNANNVDILKPTILQIGNHGIKITNSTGVRVREPRIKITGVNPTGGPYDGINADSTNSNIQVTAPYVESATGYGVNGSPLTSSLDGGRWLTNTLGNINSNTLNSLSGNGMNTSIEGKFGRLEDVGRQWYSLTANSAFRLATVAVDVNNVAYQLRVEVTGLDDSTPDCYLFATRYVKNNGGTPVFVTIGTDAASAGLSLSLAMFNSTSISVNVTSTVNARIGAVVKAVSGGGTSGTAKRGVAVAMT